MSQHGITHHPSHHMEAWRETGRCVLYQMQGVVTTRSYVCAGEQRPRFTLD